MLLSSARATTVPAMTEAAQMADAALIVRARAESVTAARESTGRGTAIVTSVRFTPLAVYKGSAPDPLSLRFLGGKIDDLEMRVGAMPTFTEGGEYVLFVSATENAACPLVGWVDGSLPVDRTANAAGVVTLPTGEKAGSIVTGASRTVLTGDTPLAEFEQRLRDALAGP